MSRPLSPLAATALRMRDQGLSGYRIAKELGVSCGTAQYWLQREKQRKRPRRNREAETRPVDVQCACGERDSLQAETVRRYQREGRRWRCQACRRGRTPPQTRGFSPEPWMLPDEQVDPRVWAERVAATLSPKELRLVAMLEPGDLDGSSVARRVRSPRERAPVGARP